MAAARGRDKTAQQRLSLKVIEKISLTIRGLPLVNRNIRRFAPLFSIPSR
jgi:hypothetical protein